MIDFLHVLATTPIVIGLAAWFGKLWAGRILEKDRAKYQTRMETLLTDLRTRDAKELFVHQLQFQKEFKVYKELWTTALKYAKALNGYCGPHLVAPQASAQELEQTLEASYERLRCTVHDNRPFYSPDVYKTATKMLDELFSCLRIRNDQQEAAKRLGNVFDKDRLRQIREQADIPAELKSQLNELCLAIRNRVWNTTLSGWDRPDTPPA